MFANDKRLVGGGGGSGADGGGGCHLFLGQQEVQPVPGG